MKPPRAGDEELFAESLRPDYLAMEAIEMVVASMLGHSFTLSSDVEIRSKIEKATSHLDLKFNLSWGDFAAFQAFRMRYNPSSTTGSYQVETVAFRGKQIRCQGHP